MDAGSALVVVVPRLVHGLLRKTDQLLLDPDALRNSIIAVPAELHGRSAAMVFGGGVVTALPELRLDALLAHFPMAILHVIDSA
jgi:hypothetical protein